MSTRSSIATIAVLALLTTGCAVETGRDDAEGGREVNQRARSLAHETLIADLHVDVPYRLSEKMDDISGPTEEGHFDYPRAREGGLDAPFMSIYVPASYQESGGARAYADELIDMVEGFTRDWPDKFEIAGSSEELLEIVGRGKLALPLGMENGAPLESDLGNLAHFRDRGVSYITLTHSENNAICDSSYADERKWNGLSPFGEEVIAEMNRLGMMIDVSHVSDETFFQVLNVSKAPVIASHSSCRRFTPGWERNMDDAMIEALGEHGGVIFINFGSAFISSDANAQSMAYWKALREYLGEHEAEDEHEVRESFDAEYWRDRQRITGTVADVADHIDHAVGLAGVDHVGLGSDFDGVATLPEGLSDVSMYPNLIAVLLERGYSEEDVRKICGGNLIRVWAEVERIGQELREGPS